MFVVVRYEHDLYVICFSQSIVVTCNIVNVGSTGSVSEKVCSLLMSCYSGFPRLLESPGIFIGNIPGPGKS